MVAAEQVEDMDKADTTPTTCRRRTCWHNLAPEWVALALA